MVNIIKVNLPSSEKNMIIFSRGYKFHIMKISKNCDQAVSEVLDELDELKAEKEENDSFDMTVCDETKKEMKQVA